MTNRCIAIEIFNFKLRNTFIQKINRFPIADRVKILSLSQKKKHPKKNDICCSIVKQNTYKKYRFRLGLALNYSVVNEFISMFVKIKQPKKFKDRKDLLLQL